MGILKSASSVEDSVQERNHESSQETMSSPPPHAPPSFAVHSPEGDEEKPMFDDAHLMPISEIPPPPDGGWGWVIVVASFMCNLILDGLAYTFGVLLEPLVDAFDSNRSSVSWVGSLLAGVYLTSGPIVGGLVNKFGCRPVCVAGSVVAAMGLALSTLSPNVPTLMITYGIIGGFGLGLIYLPAVVAVGYYFEKRRALATGISVCGSGVGTFVMAPLATFLLSKFGWKGTNLVCAGLCLMCGFFGMLMRPLELLAIPVDNEDEDNVLRATSTDVADTFTVQLPDGTHHSGDGPATLSTDQTFHVHPSQLPPIAEQSLTKQDTEPEEKHKSVHEVFQAPASSTRRKRTVSSEGGKFHVTPVKRNSSSGLPRNSSAPHFIDPTKHIPRNSSTPGLGRLARISSLSNAADACVDSNGDMREDFFYGLQDSNVALHLQPGGSGSRRGSRGPVVRPLYRKDVFYSGSVLHLVNQLEHNTDYRHSIISIPKSSRRQSTISMTGGLGMGLAPRCSIVASHLSIPRSVRKASSVAIEPEGRKPVLAVIKEMMNLDLLKNTLFLLIGISNIFGMLGFYVPFVYLPNMAKLRGIDTDDANFLISIIGISNTLGRVFVGWLSDFAWVNSLVLTNLAIFFSGVCVLVLPWCMDSYIAYVSISLLFGLFVAAYISLTSIVLVDLLGLDNLTSAFGLLVLFRGASSMVGPPLAGSIYDRTQNYDISFYMAGAFLMIAALISCVADILHRRSKNKK